MKIIDSRVGYVDTEYYVVELNEPVKIDFKQQVNDVIMSSPDIEVLVGWDYENESEFTKDNAMLLKPHDNMKELSRERCTHLYLMPRTDGTHGTVYITVTR